MLSEYKTRIKIFNSDTGKFYPDSSLTSPEVSRTINNFGCIIPPYDKSFLNLLETIDPTHTTCISIKTSASVGLGYSFKNKPNRKMENIVKRPGYDIFKTFRSLLETFAREFIIYDEAALELIRIGDRIFMYNAPIRYLYIQVNTAGRIIAYWHINNKGKAVKLIPYNGGELKSGVRYIARIMVGNTTSAYYGFPDYLSSNGAMIENSLIRRYGIKFFDNDATPSFAILITGGGLSKEGEEKIASYMKNNLKGVDNSHRVLMLNINEPDADIKLQDLSKSLEGNFLDEYSNNRDEIIRVHQIPPKMIGVSTKSGLSAGSETVGSMKDFQERTINPIQFTVEDFFNTLFEQISGHNPDMKLNTLDITNHKDMAVVAQILNKIVDGKGAPAMTQLEIRRLFDMPDDVEGSYPPPEEKKDKPNGSTYENPDAFDTTRIFYSIKEWMKKQLSSKE